MKAWAKVKTIAERSDVSPRTVRTWLQDGLRHARIRGTILIKTDWLDDFLESHEAGNPKQVDNIVSEVCKDLLNDKRGNNETG